MVHLYNFFQVSLAVAWTCNFLHPIIYFLNYLGDTILMLNSVIQCFVEYDDEYGVTVKDVRLIARHYLIERKGLLFLFSSMSWDIVPLIVAYGRNETCWISTKVRVDMVNETYQLLVLTIDMYGIHTKYGQ
jgi:hypothetical protein